MSSRSAKTNEEIQSLLRSRTVALWISSREETRVEAALLNSLPAKMTIRYWDAISGLTENGPAGKRVALFFSPARSGYDKKAAELSQQDGSGSPCQDPQVVLQAIRECPDKCLYVLRDINGFKDALTLRALRNTISDISAVPASEQRAIIILTPSAEIPQDLLGQVNLISYPMPDRSDIEKIFAAIGIEAYGDKVEQPSAETREAAINAAMGLSATEAQSAFSRSVVTRKRIDPILIATEKKRIIGQSGALTWIDANPLGMAAVGGLETLKDWLALRKNGFSAEARSYGILPPKGILLAGLPGGGKSLTAKCVAASWGIPLLKLDLGAQKSKYVGDSEANIRKALATAEACAPCVLWIDEIEKALAQGGEDGGVSKDQVGTILSWMQDRQAPVFVVATANDVRTLPPELLRKGRFDQLFWSDLPNRTEREQILTVTLKSVSRKDEIDVSALASLTAEWVGAEIASIVPEAQFIAFSDGMRAITTADLIKAASMVVPLSKTMGAKLDDIRTFMKGKALDAGKPETPASANAPDGPALDID